MNVFTVKLKNEPGTLARVAQALAARGVNITAVGGGGIGDSGVVALAGDNDAATREALAGADYEFGEAEAITADLEDRPGTLGRLAGALADAGVNVQGLLVMESAAGRARLAFAVDNAMKAREALRSAGAMGV